MMSRVWVAGSRADRARGARWRRRENEPGAAERPHCTTGRSLGDAMTTRGGFANRHLGVRERGCGAANGDTARAGTGVGALARNVRLRSRGYEGPLVTSDGGECI